MEVLGPGGEPAGVLETGPLGRPGFVAALVLRRAAALAAGLEGGGAAVGRLDLLHACLRAQFVRCGGRPAPLPEGSESGRALGVLAAGLRAQGSGEELGLVLGRRGGGVGPWELVSVCTEDELPGGRRGWSGAGCGVGGAAANERVAEGIAADFARAAAEGRVGGARGGLRGLLVSAVAAEGGQAQAAALEGLDEGYFLRCLEDLLAAARARPGEAFAAQDLDTARFSPSPIGAVFPFEAPEAEGFRGWTGAVFFARAGEGGEAEEEGFHAVRLLSRDDARLCAWVLVPGSRPWPSEEEISAPPLPGADAGRAERAARLSASSDRAAGGSGSGGGSGHGNLSQALAGLAGGASGEGPRPPPGLLSSAATAVAGGSGSPRRGGRLELLQLSPTPESPLMAAVQEERELGAGVSSDAGQGDVEVFFMSEWAGAEGRGRGSFGAGAGAGPGGARGHLNRGGASPPLGAAFTDLQKWSFSSRSSMSTTDYRSGGPSGSSRKSSFSSRKSSGTETGSLRILALDAGRRHFDASSDSEVPKGVSVSPSSSFVEDGSDSDEDLLPREGRFPLHTRIRIPEFPEIFVHDFLSPQVQLQQQGGAEGGGQGSLKDTLSRMTAAFEVSERYVAQRLSVLGTVERAEVRESSLGQYYAVVTMSEWADSNVHRSILGGHLAGINDFYRGEDVAVHLHVKSGTTLDPPLPEGWIRLQCPGEKYAGKCACGKVFTSTRRPVVGFAPVCKGCASRRR